MLTVKELIMTYNERKEYLEAVLADNEEVLEHYRDLEDDSLFLECLNEAGVDNWGGFDYAQELFGERS